MPKPRSSTRSSPSRAVAWLEANRETFGSAAAAKRQACFEVAGAGSCRSAEQLRSLHESLCFSLAYPDNAAVSSLVRRLAREFHLRTDVARFADELEGHAIAGVPLYYRLFWPTARWLAEGYRGSLRIDWEQLRKHPRLLNLLALLFTKVDEVLLDEEALSARAFLELCCAKGQTDAELLVQRLRAVPMPEPMRERAFDDLDLPFVLAPGAAVPSRTTAGERVRRPHYQTEPRSRTRPDVALECRRPPRELRWLSGERARFWIDQARTAMLTRSRDLEAIAYANPSDVVEVVDDPGLRFVGFGILPERRFLLEATYVFLVVQNGVPVGYMQGSGMFGWSEVNYNLFEPFRGADAARLYARCLAALHAVMGTRTFVVPPYQLGRKNEEAVVTGAFWFYYKLGFRPRTAAAKDLVERELAAMRRRPEHRTSLEVLRKLAAKPLFLSLGDERARLPYGAVTKAALSASRNLSGQAVADRDGAAETVRKAAARRLGLPLRRLESWSASEQRAFVDWGPLIVILPGIEGWSPAERRALASVVRARGGPTESDYLRRLDAHAALEASLTELVS